MEEILQDYLELNEDLSLALFYKIYNDYGRDDLDAFKRDLPRYKVIQAEYFIDETDGWETKSYSQYNELKDKIEWAGFTSSLYGTPRERQMKRQVEICNAIDFYFEGVFSDIDKLYTDNETGKIAVLLYE